MVTCHATARPQRIVVKPDHTPRKPHPSGRTCIFCGATLASDRRDRDPWCTCHHRTQPVGSLDLRVIWAITTAHPHSVNVARFLDADRDAVWRAVQRWRGRGVRIVGLRSVGYRLGG